MKRWGKALAAVILGMAAFVSAGSFNAHAAPSAAKPVTVLLDDVLLTFDGAEPEITKDYTFVPFRTLGEALGITIEWDQDTKTITATRDEDGGRTTVVLQVGSEIAMANGQSVRLAAAPYIKNNRTLIPLSFFSTQFGARVGWDGATRTVSIVSPAREMHLRGFYAISSYSERDKIRDMNSVAFGWVRVDENGELTLSGQDYYWPKPAGEITPESIVQDAAKQGIDPYLMVYAVDGRGELTKMLSDPALAARSIDNITDLVKEKNFSGILLDYEGLGLKLDPISQQKLLNDYVRQLAGKLKPEGIRISLAVPPPNSVYKGYDYKTLAEMADDLVVMAYDYHASETPSHTPEPNDKVHAAIRSLLEAGVPNEKLLMGINLWSETPESIDDKLGLAKRYSLKGAAFWRIGLFSYYGREMTEAISRSAIKIQE